MVIPHLNDKELFELIDAGMNIAHDGPLKTNKGWRFNKLKSKDLKEDYSNFLDLAEEVRTNPQNNLGDQIYQDVISGGRTRWAPNFQGDRQQFEHRLTIPDISIYGLSAGKIIDEVRDAGHKNFSMGKSDDGWDLIVREYKVREYQRNPKPRRKDKKKVYYHGTGQKSGELIIKDGYIKPGSEVGFSYLCLMEGAKPMEGMVYITEELDRSIHFALSSSDNEVYVFEIDGKNLIDIYPDEDEIGNLINKKTIDWLNKRAMNYLLNYRKVPKGSFKDIEILDDDGNIVRIYSEDERIQKLLDKYDNLYVAVTSYNDLSLKSLAGREIIKHLTDKEMLHLIDVGKNIANKSPLKFSRVWKIKGDDYDIDENTFFDRAIEIPMIDSSVGNPRLRSKNYLSDHPFSSNMNPRKKKLTEEELEKMVKKGELTEDDLEEMWKKGEITEDEFDVQISLARNDDEMLSWDEMMAWLREEFDSV